MGIYDLIVTPLVIIITYFFAYFYKHRIQDPRLRPYFIPGLTVKLMGAIATGLVYFYYYGDGDTVYFFRRSKIMYQVLADDFWVGLKLLFNNPNTFDPDTYLYLATLNAKDGSSFLVARIACVIGLFCFYTYSSISVFFSVLCFTGLWKMFQMFARVYPNSIPQLAIACLFIPSVFFWGSGIFKDTITMGSLAWLTVAISRIFIERRNILFYIVISLISIHLIGILKSYILLAFLPSVMFWVFLTYKSKIKSRFINVISTPIVVAMTLFIGYVLVSQLSTSYEKYSIQNITSKATDMQRWHTAVEETYDFEGSSYNLGKVDFTIMGVASKIPAAINTTLFRPYLWEVENVFMLLAFIESLLFLFFTLLILWRGRLINPFIYIFRDPTLAFCFIFSMIFAFAVGFTSYNFGALVRYKIPCMPYYAVILVVLMERFKPAPKVRRKYAHRREPAIAPSSSA